MKSDRIETPAALLAMSEIGDLNLPQLAYAMFNMICLGQQNPGTSGLQYLRIGTQRTNSATASGMVEIINNTMIA